MGFDVSRGDQVQVTNMQFVRMDDTTGTPAPKPLLGLDNAYWFKIIEAAIMGLTRPSDRPVRGQAPDQPHVRGADSGPGSGTFAIANASPVMGALPPPPAAAADGAAQPAAPAAALALVSTSAASTAR